MPARVQEHVGDRVSHLARRAQHAHVVAIGQDGSRTVEHAVHGSSEACSESLHPASKCALMLRLDDEVGVIRLQRVVHQPELLPIARGCERALDLPHYSHRAKRWNVVPHPQRHVAGEPSSERSTRSMPDARIRAGLPSGTGSSPAVSNAIEFELFHAMSH
jgi:hypothetical protein